MERKAFRGDEGWTVIVKGESTIITARKGLDFDCNEVEMNGIDEVTINL